MSTLCGHQEQYLWIGRLEWWCPFLGKGTEGCFPYTSKSCNLVFWIRKSGVVSILILDHWASSLPFARSWRVYGSFPEPVHKCFVDLKKSINCISWGIVWKMLCKSGSHCWQNSEQGCPLSPILFIVYIDEISNRIQVIASHVIVVCRCCCSVGDIRSWTSTLAGLVCSQVWNSWDENQQLQI